MKSRKGTKETKKNKRQNPIKTNKKTFFCQCKEAQEA